MLTVRARLALLLGLATVSSAHAQAPADLVLRGGTVYTVSDQQPKAEAVAVSSGRIVFVGSTAGAAKFVGPQTRVVEIGDRVVLPGLTDSHYHLLGVGQREFKLNLQGSRSVAEVLMRLRSRVSAAEPGQWVTGYGWIETHWTPARFLTRADLDSISPDNPVFLTRADGHASVANSAALRVARVSRDAMPPFGGDLLRDAHGELTGMLIDNAQALVRTHIPDPSQRSLTGRCCWA
jgi:predicted amidohydrolase YtcJ